VLNPSLQRATVSSCRRLSQWAVGMHCTFRRSIRKTAARDVFGLVRHTHYPAANILTTNANLQKHPVPQQRSGCVCVLVGRGSMHAESLMLSHIRYALPSTNRAKIAFCVTREHLAFTQDCGIKIVLRCRLEESTFWGQTSRTVNEYAVLARHLGGESFRPLCPHWLVGYICQLEKGSERKGPPKIPEIETFKNKE
jgi:hypothetical protein